MSRKELVIYLLNVSQLYYILHNRIDAHFSSDLDITYLRKRPIFDLYISYIAV